MIDTQEIAQRYIASWNETDDGARRRLIDGLWTEYGRYADPMMQAEGHNEITALIGGVHTRFPGYRFALTGQPDGHGPYIRFSWSLAPDEGGVVARGTDFAAVDPNGRLIHVTGFLDQVPG